MRAFISGIFIAFCLSGQMALGQTGLECNVLTGPTVTGGPPGVFSPVTSTAPANPATDLAGGFQITGGGCLSEPSANGAILEQSKPSAAGYSCTFIPNGTRQTKVTAFAVACRSAPRAAIRDAAFTNNGLGGSIVAIARNSDDNGSTKIPYSFRVCNKNGNEIIGVYYGQDKINDYIVVPFGSCVELDSPTRILFHTPSTVSVDVSGTYELLKQGTYTGIKAVSPANDKKPAIGQFVTLSKPRVETAACFARTDVNLPPFPIPGGTLDASYWGYCKAPSLIGGKSYRVCFDSGYSNQPAGSDEYPGGLLPMVLDGKDLQAPIDANPFGFKYIAIAQGGCLDLFNVSYVFFVPTQGWIGQNVTKITYRVMEILP